MKKINTSGRTRNWNIVFYGRPIDFDKIRIIYGERISKFAYIIHEKDTYDDDIIENGVIIHKKGELKKKHIHINIVFHYAHTFSAVKKLFTTKDDKPRVEPISDMSAMHRYLTHKDNPEKYQYDDDLIVSNDIDYFNKIVIRGNRDDRDNLAFAIVQDLLNHTPPFIMLQRYGRDYVIHRRQYQEMYEEIRDYNVSHMEDSDAEKWYQETFGD